MPLSLAPFLLRGMQYPAVLLWIWVRTPCICLQKQNLRVEFFYPALLRHSGCNPAFGDSHMSSAVENSSVSVHVKILEFQPACAKLLPTEAFLWSIETTRMECLDATVYTLVT